jgi:GTP-binding protein
MADHAADAPDTTGARAHLTNDEAAAIEAGRKLFAAECRFVHAAQRLDQLPQPMGAEVVFAGRSNGSSTSSISPSG